MWSRPTRGPHRPTSTASSNGQRGQAEHDFRQQAVPPFENLKSALAPRGTGAAPVVKLHKYSVDMKYLPVFLQVAGQLFV